MILLSGFYRVPGFVIELLPLYLTSTIIIKMWHFMFLLKLSETWKICSSVVAFLWSDNFWSRIPRNLSTNESKATFSFVFAYLTEKASFRSREPSKHLWCIGNVPLLLIRWHSWLLISLRDIIINSNGNWFNSISNTSYRTCSSELQLHFERNT